jgi:preprotein translocase subunit YajC
MELLLLPLLLVGLLWVMGAPQRRMRKEQAAMMASLAPGAEVMTHGGLYGTVVEIDDDVVVLETSPDVTMRWAKRAIARVVTPVESEEDEELDEEYDDEYSGDEEYEEYDEDADDDADAWEDVEVPDDASSLTQSPDESTDDDKPTA